jgi:hypothetical protein
VNTGLPALQDPSAVDPTLVPVGVATQWNTPRLLRTFLGVVLALAVLLFVLGEVTLARARHATKTLGRDAAPSIFAAQEISTALADMDANAANYLLGNAMHRTEASKNFEERRSQVTRRLVDAAENITYGEAERRPVLDLFEGLGRYLETFGQARQLHDRGSEQEAAATYRDATELLHATLLPAAKNLDAANREYMDVAYDDVTRSNGGAEGAAVLIGGALLALLVGGQFWLATKFRRILSPPLAGATVLSLAFTLYLVSIFGDARAELRLAKLDAFESIHVLLRARSTAYDANGDESRFLLDREAAPLRVLDDEAAFARNVHVLASDPDEVKRLSKDWKSTGLFVDELGNVTFPGERDAARAMVKGFLEYLAIDKKIRSLEKAGKHADAIELCIGTRPDESNAVFGRFDELLEEVVTINRKAFDRAIDDADGQLRRAEFFDPMFCASIAALVFFGVRRRLQEYRVA